MVPKVPVFDCTPPPMAKLAQAIKTTVTLANCMWTSVQQLIFHRLKVWNVVSTPLRASNLSPERNLLQDICTPLCFRTTLITNAAHPWEREGFSKTDSSQYCNSRDTQIERELNF